MNTKHAHQQKIAEAIYYIKANFKSRPGLKEIARAVQMSPFHFQKVFSAWVGISPGQYVHFLSVGYAKRLLSGEGLNLSQAAHTAGLSGTGRLHDLFVNIEAMTPGAYKQQGNGLKIVYGFYETTFGRAIIGSTDRGICHLAFIEDDIEAQKTLKLKFPFADLEHRQNLPGHLQVLDFLQNKIQADTRLHVHLKGTPFQIKVWEALLKIPEGRLETYGSIAKAIGHAGAGRAVGTAIGSNPVAWLIPCHRVIRSDGHPGGYHWGLHRKMDILDYEIGKVPE